MPIVLSVNFFSCNLKAAHVYTINCAGVAQLVEQLTCNQQVAGSIPVASSIELGSEYVY